MRDTGAWLYPCPCHRTSTLEELRAHLASSLRLRQAIRELRLSTRCAERDATPSLQTVRAIVDLVHNLDALEIKDFECTSALDVTSAPMRPVAELRLSGSLWRAQEHAPWLAVLNLFARIDRLVVGSFEVLRQCTAAPACGTAARVHSLVVDIREDGYAAWRLDADHSAPFAAHLGAAPVRAVTLCHPAARHVQDLSAAWPALRELAYVVGCGAPTLAPEACRSLRALTVGVRLFSYAQMHCELEDALGEGWEEMLCDLGATEATKITSLSIVFLVAYHSKDDDELDGTFDTALKTLDWCRLESVLSRRFTQLEKLSIQIGSHTGNWDGPTLADCRKVVETVARERLSIKYTKLLEIKDTLRTFVSVHYRAW
ncbi:hypothetical protein PsYK624_161300 [Phanerochaete sordida]|uniref:Uncharacterized protein n=1 Tax=Phanerochaete sordida TaxID=48140 RepID=A0A9P3GS76_9APHY|nr:hypothetical protein PsYK624_161300 [Phanerochaete sordida]